jgi:hypothetical protein
LFALGEAIQPGVEQVTCGVVMTLRVVRYDPRTALRLSRLRWLIQQLKEGKQILFSHDPLNAKADSFFEREVDFLKRLGYRFEQKNQWTWEAIK